MILSSALDAFVNGGYVQYDGYRATDLPWASSMCKPLCFDPEDAQEQLEWGGVSENALENIVPLAQFYEENSVETIDDIWAFIVAKVKTDGSEEILLWTDEGPTSLGKDLNQFLAGLLPPDHPDWRMK